MNFDNEPIDLDSQDFQRILMESLIENQEKNYENVNIEYVNDGGEEEEGEGEDGEGEKYRNDDDIINFLSIIEDNFNKITQVMENNNSSLTTIENLYIELENILKELNEISVTNKYFTLVNDSKIKGENIKNIYSSFIEALKFEKTEELNLKKEQDLEYEQALEQDKKMQKEMEEREEDEILSKILEMSQKEIELDRIRLFKTKFENIVSSDNMINLRIMHDAGISKIKLPSEYTIDDIKLYLNIEFLEKKTEDYTVMIMSDLKDKEESLYSILSDTQINKYAKKTIVIKIL